MARMGLCVFFFLLVSSFPSSYSVVHKEQRVPALFVFGDSVVDGGNNVIFDHGASTGHLPYGVDFPTGPTGRFTNGLNPGDILAVFLNFTHLPPAVLDPKAVGGMITIGVNYASGGSGILDYPNSKSISLKNQTKLFKNTTLPDLRKQFNETELSTYLAKSIFAFNTGGNDVHELCELNENRRREQDERQQVTWFSSD
ncbi:GDSL esterase/lipase At1g71250-like [Nymphaea colorata]|nr:GDSL esterase/lipase At1g71250-like [Nymphaea colorata]